MRRPIHSRGQVMLFIVFILLGVAMLAILNADVFSSITGKNRTQNAGDAAALAAARRQGVTLNEIGELNLEHVAACLDYDRARIGEILARQNYLSWIRPLEGFKAAQEAARRNGMKDDPEFAEILRERAMYLDVLNNALPDEDRIPGDYIEGLRECARAGVCAAPDNAQFVDPAQMGHYLLNQEFYYAVNGRNWCWFHFNAAGLLSGYSSFRDWGALPDFSVVPSECEINRLEVRREARDLLGAFREEGGSVEDAARRLADLLVEHGHSTTAFGQPVTAELILTNEMIGVELPVNENGDPVFQSWYFYAADKWSAWTEIDPFGETGFPVIGRVKEEFNVSGCGAAYRVHQVVTNVSLGAESQVEWIAAAKPFGYVEADGERRPVTHWGRFILPDSFRRARLIPADAIPGGVFGMSDPAWVRHILPDADTGESHLTRYLADGPSATSHSCPYCAALRTWERESFRKGGVEWLKEHSGSCRRPTGGGGHRGGTHHGH